MSLRRKPSRAFAPPEPITIDRARELLGDEADDMTDDEVYEVSRQAEDLAFIIMRMFQERRVQ